MTDHPLLKLLKFSDVATAVGVIGIVFMLIIPMPSPVLDFLLVVNIAQAIITILISIYIEEPLEFAVFPTLLLVATLFRLALDVSSTRMVLLFGNIKDQMDGNSYDKDVVKQADKMLEQIDGGHLSDCNEGKSLDSVIDMLMEEGGVDGKPASGDTNGNGRRDGLEGIGDRPIFAPMPHHHLHGALFD